MLLSAALCGCGGGGDSAAPPEASVATFQVKAAVDAFTTAGMSVNLAGRDNALKAVNRADYNDWNGTFSLSRRLASSANPISGCAPATILVDVKVVLTRVRDGFRMQEGATFGYDAAYKPICALLLDGFFWTWNLSQPLPVASAVRGNLSGVEFTGTISRTPEALDIDSKLASIVGLDADTANSAYLAFVYHVNSPVQFPGFLPFRMFGEDTEFRFRIDPAGKLLGFQFVRTGVLPDLSGPVTITMTSR